MRVAIGGVSHETNTFSSTATGLAEFPRRTLLGGETLLRASRGVGNALGGMADAATALGWELVPLLFASATPGGRVKRGAFETLAHEITNGLTAALAAGPLDGVLLALHEAGRRVPEDFSVVGFDDVPEAAYFIPPLTTMRQDFAALGRRCIEAVLVRINGEPPLEADPLLPVLVVRASTARPPR